MSLTIYRASAGSGKTYTLTHAFVRQLLAQERPTGYLHQLALTFTRKATEEMKVRILNLLNDLSLPLNSERGAKMRENFLRDSAFVAISEEQLRRRAVAQRNAILHDYGRFSIYTIDAFFQRIVHSFIWEAGLPPTYTVELDNYRLLQEAIDLVVDEVSTNEQNRKWIGEILSNRIQEGRRWNVQEAFAEVGKQVFDERFRSFGSKFIDQLCDKEFLSSYMKELRSWDAHFKLQMERYAADVLASLEKAGLCSSDFKGKTRSFMHYFDRVKEGLYTPTDSVRNALDNGSLWASKKDPKAMFIESIYNPLNQLMHNCIDYYDLQAPLWFSIGLAIKWLPQMGLAADILRHMNAQLSNNNSVHLSQTLLFLSTLSSYSDAPFILERMGCRYRDFLLDEFQDTSVLQWKVMLPLIHNGLAQGGDSLVVGDVKQSIYRWRNSDWSILSGGVLQDLPMYQVNENSLDINWRSREVLVQTVGDIFKQLIETVCQDFLSAIPQTGITLEETRLEAITQEIRKAYTDVSQQVAPDKKESGGYLSIVNVIPNEELSAKEQVLERLPDLIMELQDRGFSASDIAILVRKNEEGQQVASMLTSAKSKPQATAYCFEVVSTDALFLAHSPEVQLIVAIIKRFVYPHDGLNNRLIEQLCIQLDTKCDDSLWNGALLHFPLSEAFEEIIRLLDWTKRSASFSFIQELHHHILNFSQNQAGDTFSFIRWWELHGQKEALQSERSTDAITIMTIHKAKGLEYPVVIIPFCDWGLDYLPAQAPLLWVKPQLEPISRIPYLPQRYGPDMALSLFSDEYYYEKMQYRVDVLNIFYVAATRAKEELHLFLPQHRRTSYNLASILQQLLFSEKTTKNLNFGTPVNPLPSPPSTLYNSVALTQYPSASPTQRLHTRLPDEPFAINEISPRKRGTMLHRILSHIGSINDIDNAFALLIEEGWLEPNHPEQIEYKQILKNALSQPQVADWFDGSWLLRNEASILLPAANGQTIRPDRVMEKQGRIVVIDYKFGAPHPAHQYQMDEYVQVLNQMGHTQVEGIVWYITTNEEVDCLQTDSPQHL